MRRMLVATLWTIGLAAYIGIVLLFGLGLENSVWQPIGALLLLAGIAAYVIWDRR